MTSPRHHTQDDGITGRVRRNAGPAGVAAACLLLFGFGAGFASQRVTDLFTLGDAVFNYTLRIGGVLMAGVAIWSLTGRVAGLLIDALVSIAIGALMVFSGSAMIAGGVERTPGVGRRSLTARLRGRRAGEAPRPRRRGRTGRP